MNNCELLYINSDISYEKKKAYVTLFILFYVFEVYVIYIEKIDNPDIV